MVFTCLYAIAQNPSGSLQGLQALAIITLPVIFIALALSKLSSELPALPKMPPDDSNLHVLSMWC